MPILTDGESRTNTPNSLVGTTGRAGISTCKTSPYFRRFARDKGWLVKAVWYSKAGDQRFCKRSQEFGLSQAGSYSKVRLSAA